ncbi:MAG: endonuclease domain-containing protein [Gammaproteobacteria bacterium]|nr:endonuclease domain-containing protein [Gammaproteobacteria bacterium]
MTKIKARSLRQTSTPAEQKLWQYLRNKKFNGSKFRRQFPIGPYIVDFVCLNKKLIIELDGSQHLEQIDYDAERTRYLMHFNFRVLRFWNNEVFNQFPSVLERIFNEITL